jgi:hypothetical protein
MPSLLSFFLDPWEVVLGKVKQLRERESFLT